MKVLIVKTSSMGDVIHTFPAVEDARRNRPDVSFDWCVEEAFAGIVALHPAIATIHTVAIRRWRTSPHGPSTWREAAALRRALRDCRYDLVIDAQGLLKSALVAKLAAAPIAGFDRLSAREPSATLFYDRRYAVSRDLHAIERTRRLFGLALGYEPDFSGLESGIVPPAGGSTFVGEKTAFLLHGTSREDKKWPVGDWIETARLLVERGMMPITTWSNDREKAVAEAIAEAVPQTVLVPKSPLAEIAAIIGRSALVIGADTGLAHLASAFGLPTIAVFLATEPGLTGPRGPFSSTLLAAPGSRIAPAEVVAEAEKLLERHVHDLAAGRR
ncbi:lipopolysaccharide heptosyltransferase I [Mesorhizobium sp.]|uniref:lipopolysaccharide heptosyltransferase I n=1 Tax=Mesorhizobium sp. TaxID=1871066 RepID=UPI000FE4D6CF|nr:lipopolysaccharide heptosyltransferase I [Mesorhizobium sp.]RWK62824.1 MAG: lipopolysaccharide heptosyltransferase I [Mesorhizobium sp.]RWM49702.1 MAG: lipopolysaccharide heptosyltransferase I [Mesorhizobium sp.]RWM56100.1 MAG: lipopolysaccharide heptosyltransferase I [Mesorhizobium sp.]RWM59314.1 MAG: lipopolysaccharide heptosyltransferase I [Mesorhizobium sp.]RWN01914.1 MAG: lipopolysaccharide heptosyltransferase I [Mesorhizobium sp.]